MKRTTELPLLLAPAGGEAAFSAAVAAGADAIYLGSNLFNARAYAENFDEETLARCVRLAHAHGVKVHVTMNTLLTDRELPEALALAFRLWEMGVDALIVADVGLISCIHACLPQFPLHASTQLSLHSTAGAEEVSDLGFDLVVPARELDRENLASICRNAPALVEGFVHGALCVSYSGQCLFSSLVGGRSGNRGACAQPCRLPYNGGYPLSLKDLSLASHIPALIEDGVACLKIEGRMKSASYVWGVTKIFRRLLDERRGATEEEKAALARIFSREGHTDGYYTKRLADMTGVRREEDKEQSRGTEEIIPTPAPVQLTASCRIVAGEAATLTLRTLDGREVTVRGSVPDPARSAPLTAASVCERLAKMGGTPYELNPADIRAEVGEGLNLSPAAINALRRAATDALTNPGREAVTPVTPAPPATSLRGGRTTALFADGAVWEALDAVERAFFDLVFIPLWDYEKTACPPAGVWLPPVIFDREEAEVVAALSQAKARGATHALCGNPAQVKYAREAGLVPYGDFRLNITNAHTAAYWRSHGVEEAILSPELTAAQMRDIGGSTIVYGRIPLMLTERCYVSGDGTCRNCGEICRKDYVLVDRREARFPVMRVPSHRNMILNSLPTYMGDRKEEIPRGLGHHFIFTVEDAGACRRVITSWRQGKALDLPVRRFAKPQNGKEMPEKQGKTLTEHKRASGAQHKTPSRRMRRR